MCCGTNHAKAETVSHTVSKIEILTLERERAHWEDAKGGGLEAQALLRYRWGRRERLGWIIVGRVVLEYGFLRARFECRFGGG